MVERFVPETRASSAIFIASSLRGAAILCSAIMVNIPRLNGLLVDTRRYLGADCRAMRLHVLERGAVTAALLVAGCATPVAPGAPDAGADIDSAPPPPASRCHVGATRIT